MEAWFTVGGLEDKALDLISIQVLTHLSPSGTSFFVLLIFLFKLSTVYPIVEKDREKTAIRY